MRVIKRSPESFNRMVEMTGKHCRFIRIPSSKEPYLYTGLLMADGAWVSWPDNLTDEEMKLYIERYGTPPDIFELEPEKAEYLRMVKEDGYEH